MVQGDELNAVDRVSVNPGDRDPLRSGGHQVYSLLQQAEGVVNFIVDDGLVEVVSVGLLQHLRFLLEPLKRVILSHAWGDGGSCDEDNIGSKLSCPEDL